ncbi:hypothetical protein ACOMHN_024236 [Nucella lapillus]
MELVAVSGLFPVLGFGSWPSHSVIHGKLQMDTSCAGARSVHSVIHGKLQMDTSCAGARSVHLQSALASDVVA